MTASASLTTGNGETQVNDKLFPTDPDQASAFGYALAASGDVLAVAAPSSTTLATNGAAYVFYRDTTTGAWVQQKKLALAGSSDEFDLTIAADGDLIAVGVPNQTIGGHFQQGGVHVFRRDKGGTHNWGAKHLTDAAVGSSGHFGASVALEGDLLFVGATMPPFGGRVDVFQRNRGGADAWGLITTILDSTVGDGGTNEAFGSALAVDHDTLLVGASKADVSSSLMNDGAAYIFTRDPVNRDQWNYSARLTAAEATICTNGLTVAQIDPDDVETVKQCALAGLTRDDSFGSAVALEGDTAVVGAISADGTGVFSAGAVYVFERNAGGTGRWGETAKLQVNPTEAFTYVGGSVALHDDQILAGAHGTTVDGRMSQGAAFAFVRDPIARTWSAPETLIAGDGLGNEYFGRAVAIDGSNRLVGAYGRGLSRGAVYVDGHELPPPPPTDCTPAVTPTDTLHSPGSVIGSTGFAVGVPSGALADPLPVWIAEVPAPPEPLPSNVTAIGAYVNIGAQCTTYTAPRKHFRIGVPVPAGTDTSHLGVAVLLPPEALVDGGATANGWVVRPGTYDAVHNLFIITTTGLSTNGRTFVLVDNPVSALAAPATPSLAPNLGFDIHCSDTLPACFAATATIATAFDDALTAFTDAGLPPPDLESPNGQYLISVLPVTEYPCVSYPGAFGVTIMEFSSITLCIDHPRRSRVNSAGSRATSCFTRCRTPTRRFGWTKASTRWPRGGFSKERRRPCPSP